MSSDYGNLMLSRRPGETIILKLDGSVDPSTPIGELFEQIELTVEETKPSQVRLSVWAPQSIRVLRGELDQT